MRSAIHALTALAAASVLSLLALTPATADATRLDPQAGECHQISSGTLLGESDPAAPVDCAGPHNTVTVAVETVPRYVPMTDDDATYAAVGTACLRAEFRYLAMTPKARDFSAYGLATFRPTKAELAAGAHWLRCDLVLYGNDKALPLTVPLTVGRTPLDDAIARCYNLKRGLLVTTTCAQRHHYRVSKLIWLHGGYKAPAQFENIGNRSCHDGRGGYVLWSTYEAWKAGDKHVSCIKRTTR